MNFDQLRVFAKVVDAGSFTRAAELLASQKSHVSRVVAQLEARLGVKLLERTTRSLAVTEVGREVHERALAILAAVDETELVAQRTQGVPQGTLRLTCGVEFGLIAVNGWVDAYLQAHPQVACEVEYTSRVLDLVHEGFDLAVRVGVPDPSRLVARHLGQLEYGVFACPRYLAAAGTPATPEALREHRRLVFSGGQQRAGWRLRRGDEVVTIDGRVRLRVNNSFAVRDAALASLGVAVLPLMVAADAVQAGRLVLLLPDWQPAPVPINAVFPSGRYLAPKVRAFIDLAAAQFPRAEQAAAWRHRMAACAVPATQAAPARRR